MYSLFMNNSGRTDISIKRVHQLIIVIGSMAMMGCSIGAINNCFSLYTIPVTQGLHISRSIFSEGQTALFVGSLLSTSQVGKFINRWGTLRILYFGTFLLPLVYSLYSIIHTSLSFIFVSLFCGFLIPFVSMVPSTILIQRYIKYNTGLALGIAMMGSGIGGMIFNPIGNTIMQHFGWRNAFFYISFILFVIMLIVSNLLLIVVHSVKPFSIEKAICSNTSAYKNELTNLSSFILLILLSCCMGAGSYVSINYTSTYLQDIGYSSNYSASIASLSMGVMAIGKILVGKLYDLIGVTKTTFLCLISLFIGMLGFFKASAGLPAIIAILIGVLLGCPMGTVSSSIILKYLFGNKDVTIRLGQIVTASNLGAAITPLMAAIMYRFFYSYQYLYLFIGCVSIFSLLGYAKLFHTRLSN